MFLYVQWRHFHACAADANVTKVSPVIVDGRGMSCTWSVTEGAAGLRQKSVAYSNENSWGNSILPVSITNWYFRSWIEKSAQIKSFPPTFPDPKLRYMAYFFLSRAIEVSHTMTVERYSDMRYICHTPLHMPWVEKLPRSADFPGSQHEYEWGEFDMILCL